MSDANNVNNKAVTITEGLTSNTFYRLLNLAIMGRGKLQGTRIIASGQPRQHNDQEDAIHWSSNQHIMSVGGQGFATNWGGFLLSLMTTPANMAAVAFVQARAVTATVHLCGYELNDPWARTAIFVVMLGPCGSAALITSGDLPNSVATIVTAPAFDPQLDSRVSQAFLGHSTNQVSGKCLGVLLTKKVLLVGGGVGAVVDGWFVCSIVRYAQEQLASRRLWATGYVVTVED